MKSKEYVESNRQYGVMDLLKKVMYSNKEYEFVKHLKYFEIVCVDIPLFV